MKPFYSAANGERAGGRCLRGRFDFAAIADRVRMPWRFQARHMAVDGHLTR
jgi:hypothetical protein